jgi:protein-disulfide isomerase
MPSKGPKDAPITLISFTDFQCPYCQRAFYTIKELLSFYPDKVHYVYIDFPLGRHKMGKKAAHAVRCAGEQDSFWAYHDALFYKEKLAASKDFYHIASVLKLKPGKFRQCMESGKYNDRITQSIRYGQELGVRGTPGFFVNGRKLSGALPLTTFVRLFEQEGVSY